MDDIDIRPPAPAKLYLYDISTSIRIRSLQRLRAIGFPIAAVLVALCAGAALLAINGFNALDVFTVMIGGVFRNIHSITEMLLIATPLILIGVGLCVAFRCSMWNIGAEGQYYAGAVAATFFGVHLNGLPAPLHIVLILAAGSIAGAAWAAIAGLLKIYFNASEIVTTIMLNYIATIATSYLVTGPMMEAGVTYPQSTELPHALRLPILLPHTRLHIGILIAIALAVIVQAFLFRSSAGYALRVVGINPHAARYAGISVRRSVVLAISISGALAGLAGAIQIAGVDFRLYQNISPGYGFTGIAVALLAYNRPIGAIFSGILFAVLSAGSVLMQMNSQVPQVLVFVIEGMVILSVVAFGALGMRAGRSAV
ncbi:ABC transporter permease [Acidiphilium iwatense]|uniref:ABC transporter permease n=1 Tax=Acidiphilium iwatense TaxID=768198 RepID=A0ABS9DZ25_9PROT|nr:ABC transporter permease [Acidiphilium iwatense]MCF3947986.1 ABC transporter permease [Acidiphilium iwatense]